MDISMEDNRDSNDTKRDSMSFIESINSLNFTIENFVEYQREVMATEKTIMSQLENNKIAFRKVEGKIDNIEKEDRFKTLLDQEKIVTEELYVLLKQLAAVYSDSYGWMNLLFSMYKNAATKQSALIHEQKKLSVSRDLLKEVKEMDQASRIHWNETMKTVVEQSQKKFFDTIEIQSKENTLALRETLGIVMEMVRSLSEKNIDIDVPTIHNEIKEVPTIIQESRQELKKTIIDDPLINKPTTIVETTKIPTHGFGEDKNDDIENDFDSDFGV